MDETKQRIALFIDADNAPDLLPTF